MDNKDMLVKRLAKQIDFQNIDGGTLYGVPVASLTTSEELQVLAYWALTKYHKELNYGYKS
jgi:hypothetical protein